MKQTQNPLKSVVPATLRQLSVRRTNLGDTGSEETTTHVAEHGGPAWIYSGHVTGIWNTGMSTRNLADGGALGCWRVCNLD